MSDSIQNNAGSLPARKRKRGGGGWSIDDIRNTLTSIEARKTEPKRYAVEVDTKGCDHCGRGTYWTVVDPTGTACSASYEDKEKATRLARMLNVAYDLGLAK
jgi:hypothetical protein